MSGGVKPSAFYDSIKCRKSLVKLYKMTTKNMITINITYTGEDQNAKRFMEEMISSGINDTDVLRGMK